MDSGKVRNKLIELIRYYEVGGLEYYGLTYKGKSYTDKDTAALIARVLRVIKETEDG